MKALLIKTDNQISTIQLEAPLYKSIPAVIGGYMELVRPMYLSKPYCMIVDEEGLLKKREMNLIGSLLYGTPHHGQPIVGDILIMKLGSADIVGLNESDLAFLNPHLSAMPNLCEDVRQPKEAEPC